jgi:hypothetical protein
MRLGWQEQEGTRQQHTRVGIRPYSWHGNHDQRLVYGTRSNGTMRGSTYTLVRRLEEMAEMDTIEARFRFRPCTRTRREKLLPAFDSLTRGP